MPPVWPPEPGTQQVQTHLDLDLEVDDLDAACAVAGARRIGGYTEPHEDVRIHADPDGHPCCLFVRLRPGS